MIEVDKISRLIAQQNPRAKIIFGISKNAKYKNKVKVTLLMVGLPTTKKHSLVKEKKTIKKKVEKDGKKKKDDTIPPLENKEKIVLESPVGQILAPLPVNINTGVQTSVIETLHSPKKTIRRTALEIKEVQELEEKEKSKQEKEWEIPAFLRFKK